jgi:hypothetical protein
MKQTKKMRKILERMSRIEKMERGKLCQMGSGHFNHQAWQDGRNIVRYVPTDQAAFVKKAIDGYTLFLKLAGRYADEVIKQTRKDQKKEFSVSKTKRRRSSRSSKG